MSKKFEVDPISLYNNRSIDDAVNQLVLTYRPMKQVGMKFLTYALNKSDEGAKMFKIDRKKNNLEVCLENGLNIPVGETLTAFQTLVLAYKGRFTQAVNHIVMMESDDSDVNYIRVGTKYYRMIKKRDQDGIERDVLKLWEDRIIKRDYGNEAVFDKIPKYLDFIMEPDNEKYTRDCNGYYNMYEPFSHVPDKEFLGFDKIPWFHTMMKHIFGDQLELGYKYIQTLYLMPRQTLPILVMVSEDRQTGKSTFINMIGILFGDNSVVLNPENISSSFNSSYATKNVICIEESTFDNKQTTEKLKNLATQKRITVNQKHTPEFSLPFYGKLIIASNDERKFSKVDQKEIRYWVRKVPSLKGKANHQILDDFKKEIPQLLAYLRSLPAIDVTKSRMVFTEEQIYTQELESVKEEGLPWLYKEIQEYLDNHCANNDLVEHVRFTPMDLKERFFSHNSKVEVNYIRTVLKEHCPELRDTRNKSGVNKYVPIQSNETVNSPFTPTKTGRNYVIINPYYNTNIDEETI